MFEDFKFLHEAIFRAVLGCCCDEVRDARSLFGIDELVAQEIASLSPDHRRALLAPAPPGVIEFRVPHGAVADVVGGQRTVAETIGAGGLMSAEKLPKMRELNVSGLTLMRDILLHDSGLGCAVFRLTKEDAKVITNTSMRRLLEVFGAHSGSVFSVTGRDSVLLWKRIGSTSPDFAAVLPVMFKKNEKAAGI
ncbi:hypothetical protein [Duganella vulcania]|uniref:Uncharacterized protein n=1 Tax=Duganella vulcania TaxID=2692166 RepID=A0A845GJ01_9BURK|nr:hypothetical protein [Duganella vulcania]MYM92727.1 hypothetical protein [Duganella vulcania]